MIEITPFPSLEEALKEQKITKITYERVKIAKEYIEKKYRLKKIEEEEKKKEWEQVMSKMKEMKLSAGQAEQIKEEILHKQGESLRKKRQKISIYDFEPIKIIGKGAFGEVRVCKNILTGDIVAIKKMKKEEMHKKNQVLHVRAEKDVLAEANDEWIVDLKFSFQDPNYLYFGMEFLQGGDLMTLLIERDIFAEQDAKFYAAELVLAIESVHKLNCIHRDLKPDNVLIDKFGHIKLSDFGLSKKLEVSFFEDPFQNTNTSDNTTLEQTGRKSASYAMQYSQFREMKNNKRRVFAFSTVGTPDYIAPEVFSKKGYGPEVDWWSLGVIMFEMMIGYPPFYSENSKETCKKIMNWKNTLEFPEEADISDEAINLIKNLMCEASKRLGYNGAEEIKNHPFFRGIEWDNIKETLTPPFIPTLNSDYDTTYFEDFEEDEPFYPVQNDPNQKNPPKNKDMCFIDFTYKKEDDGNIRKGMANALEIFEEIKDNIKVNQKSQSDIVDDQDGNDNNINDNDNNNNNDSNQKSDIKSSPGHNSKESNDINVKGKNKDKKDFKNKIQLNYQIKNTLSINTKISAKEGLNSSTNVKTNNNLLSINNTNLKFKNINNNISQRTTIKKEKNDQQMNTISGNNVQKVNLPLSAIKGNKQYNMLNLNLAGKKEETNPFSLKNKNKTIWEKGDISKVYNKTNTNSGQKFVKLKEKTIEQKKDSKK